MPKIKVSETIDCPVEEVWAYVTNTAAIPEWAASTHKVELLGDGELDKGVRVRTEDRFLGRSIQQVSEVTEYDPPNRLGMRSVEGPFETEVVYELEPKGDSTRISMKAEAEAGLGGVFGKLLDPVVTSAFRRESQSDLGRLKDILELQAAEEAS